MKNGSGTFEPAVYKLFTTAALATANTSAPVAATVGVKIAADSSDAVISVNGKFAATVTYYVRVEEAGTGSGDSAVPGDLVGVFPITINIVK